MVLRAANNLGCKLLLDLEAAIGIELMNKALQTIWATSYKYVQLITAAY